MPVKMPARLTAYVAGSVTLAAGVISYAAFERPNFYSAAVYLSQSNACLMILCNLALVLAGSFMYTLQNFLYGPLRPAEVEQLWERGWFAVMEWIFAMSTFRDEFGIWFLCMFLSLFTGKVWGWIAEGRVEQLDQQDPGRAKLFHWKLVASLIIYLAFAVEMFLYSLDIVMFEARPGMTVMFVFEFAILWICAVSTCLRYGIWIYEHWIVQKQMKAALEARRAEIRLMHQQAAERTSAGGENSTEAANLPNENEIDEDEIDVPGWDAKKSWLFALDLTTDFLKLLAYIAFFTILTVFYGIPIYIIRDLYMTMRSFTKRITDYVRYQAATRDMHARYPDATAEDLASDGTCIVCREEMKPWGGNNAQAGAPAAPGTTINERQRPKKLPCGHILHFSCLQSWLERQQACPICRRSVFAAPPTQPGQAPVVNGQPVVPGVPGANNQIPNPNQPPARPNRNEGRVFRFRLGPLRLQFGGGRLPPAREDREVFINDLFARLRDRRIVLNPQAGAPAAAAQAPGAQPGTSPMASPTGQPANTTSVDNAVEPIHPAVRSAVSHMQLDILETQIRQEITSLNLAESRITGLRALLAELDRTRAMQRMQNTVPGLQAAALTTRGPLGLPPLPTVSRYQTPTIENGSRLINFGALPGGQTEARTLPEGMVVPPGWTLVPLNPVMAQQQPTPTIASSSAQATPPSANAASEALTAPLATSTAAASVPSPFAISSPPAGPSSSLPSSSSPAANTPTATSTTAPLVPTPTWSFPTAPDTIPVTTNSESSVAEGKKPATQTELPTTVVEPPTPVVGNESEAQGKDKQAFVEDDEE